MRADPQRESMRWDVLICERQTPGAIHVTDRDGDNYELLSQVHADPLRAHVGLVPSDVQGTTTLPVTLASCSRR
jgi:hypothetical protein